MPRQAIVVPCRLESTRFPRKLLHQIQGKPLVLWVAERLAAQAPEFEVYFAVDHVLLKNCLDSAGFRTLMTRSDHPSGTDRIAEANQTIGADEIINVQADEPLVSAQQIRTLSELIAGPAQMATLATAFKTAVDFKNPNQVKVVCDRAGRALYFSRSPMPYARDRQGQVDDAWVQAVCGVAAGPLGADRKAGATARARERLLDRGRLYRRSYDRRRYSGGWG